MSSRPEPTARPDRWRAGGLRVNVLARRGVLAAFLVVLLAAVGPAASASPGVTGSSPLAHAPGFRQAFGQQALTGPYGVAIAPDGDIWVADTDRDQVAEFTASGHLMISFGAGRPTNPNRLYMWTGMIDPGGTAGGPVIDNTPAYNNVILSWTTYPERLEEGGISWQVYQEEDNFDDNALAWFRQFGRARTSSPLWQRGMRKRAAGWFEDDARKGRLPQVSWLVAPTAQSEHPDYFPAAGAEYIASKLDAIASNPETWRTTLFILCYDENDGLFDHVPPPTARAGTPGEFVGGEPIGLGFRVPALVISPWSAGGRVCSDVLDHTSLIRVIERRFGVTEPNISAFRRRTCGDFTTALRFSGPPAGFPRSNQAISLAVAEAGLLAAQQELFSNPPPPIPVVNEPVPGQ